jgi:hypothetical protein
MGHTEKTNHHRGTETGVLSLAAAAAATGAGAVTQQNARGETKIVAVFGSTDSCGSMGYEIHVRSIFESRKDWRMLTIRSGGLFTPEHIADADLLIVSHPQGGELINYFTPDAGLADTVVEAPSFWTDRNVDAIIGQVKNRGMGLLALSNTVLCGNRRFLEFLDVREVKPHEIEPLWVTRISQTHPIMKGIGKFLVDNDAQPAVIIRSKGTDTLFQTTAIHEKRQAISGWALESGKGRIVGLLPGVTIDAYKTPEYQNIIWRAAHWAMRREIMPYPRAHNRYYI